MQKYPVAGQKGARKFLRAIYDIQEKFGVKFAGVSRTFSFGIKPRPEMQVRLEEWFRQVGAVKAQLYGAIFKDFCAAPDKYLGQKFNYATFFKGSAFARANKQYPLLTSEPVGEGLRMDISIPSFITNHKRRFDEAGISARTLREQIESNNHELNRLDIEMDFDNNVLRKKL